MKKNHKSKCIALYLILLLVLFTAGCASRQTMIVPKPPDNMEKLGRVEGKARGSIFESFFPIMYNSRTERAYADALSKAPGATALVDVTVQEDWLWYYLGVLVTVTVSGEAVK